MAESYCDCAVNGRCGIAGESTAVAKKLLQTTRRMPACKCTSSPAVSEAAFGAYDLTSPRPSSTAVVDDCRTLVKLTKDTHWLPLNACVGANTSKLTNIESLVASIFRRHLGTMPATEAYDVERTGAEWWVQVKSLAANISNAEAAIDLHYDKDEFLAESFALGNFPDISTVTYLTQHDVGKPTLVFDHCYTDDESRDIDTVRVSYPVRDKHIAFKGELLHGAPRLGEMEGSWSNDFGGDVDGEFRITLLVNLWVNNKPCISELSDEIRQKMSRGGDFSGMLFGNRSYGSEVYDRPAEEFMTMHFVSNGSTWIEGEESYNSDGEEEFEGLVLQMPVVRELACDTAVIKLAGENVAKLVHVGEEDYEDDEEDEELNEQFDGIAMKS
jgi:hypothetical protein